LEKQATLLITGANGYLGQQALLFFSERKTKLVAACRNSQERVALQEFLSQKHLDIPVLEADLGHEGHVERLIGEAQQKAGGRIDGLVNVAGAFEMFSTTEAVREHVDRLFAANFTANWMLLKHVLPGMLERGLGRIVLVSAAATQNPAPAAMGFYVASKSALNSLVQSTAAEIGPRNVRVNAVMPTIIDTPRNRQEMPGADASKWVQASVLLEVVARFLDPAPSTANGTLQKVG
jgi:NAD(P)-dependent dehydrogenase (short-subunit alcohol dehydrogenase family)